MASTSPGHDGKGEEADSVGTTKLRSNEAAAAAGPARPLEADIAAGRVIDEVHARQEMPAGIEEGLRVMDHHDTAGCMGLASCPTVKL